MRQNPPVSLHLRLFFGTLVTGNKKKSDVKINYATIGYDH